ncbi:uncharacterized protein PV09_04653 [Verruconis gallopava]|uniref:glucan 1,3-beta-glucosidase n=1 Tax=Verruconis gallopava TaxID=253628 RepID=A0A0D2AYX9_9PEZI|nr:uncharacterized protein PV09_04653 [Verruconis gallopava]KIW04369.1 hypothetical protein PV09_04653 [Verruconis gallopava]
MPHEDSDRERRRRRPSRDPESDRERRREPDQYRRRRGHRATDSQGELLPRSRDRSSQDYGSSSTPRHRRESRGGSSSGQQLSTGSLAQLNSANAKRGYNPRGYDADYLEEVRAKERKLEKERRREEREAERERRRAARHAEREERNRLEALQRDRDDEAERDRIKAEERERRREEKRQLRRAEKERQRQLELAQEEAEAEARERQRVAHRERQRQLRREEERERRHQESNLGNEDENDHASSPAVRTPRKTKWWLGGGYDELQNEDSPRARYFEQAHSPKKKSRVISGPYLEDQRSEEVYEYRKEKLEGSSQASDYTSTTLWKKKRNKRICIYVSVLIVVLIIIIPVAVVMSKKKSSSSSSSLTSSATSSKPANSNLDGLNPDSVPADKKGTYYDPWSWYDTEDFNCTYTDATVGGLPIIGLNMTWDDSVQSNPNVPRLNETFEYGTMPIRGVNVGGWLSLEPFITPSFFDKFSSRDGVIDEWTLTSNLGSKAASIIEPHYSSFINKQTFIDIRAAGFDHVRIPFSYWAVTTYDGDPYVPQISWRYLLRGIEYARQNGLRVNLDLHGAPGSQNGWNHSGRQGIIRWLNGTDGALNGQRTIDVHNQLSQFFSQPRYKNLVTMYGLVNEPRMVALNTDSVVAWSESAISTIRKNGFDGIIVFGDGFLGLDNWQGRMQNYDNLVLDVHQYVIFNNEQISLDHSDKLNFACKGWTAQTLRSMNKATGFGPTLCGEWSQADTDCTQYLNNVGVGSRWTGTLNTGNESTQVLTPQCPTNNNPVCSCDGANADPSSYSDVYKDWLMKFAIAQMDSFEMGWGWFYWTWKTESAVQWSWELGSQAGILPKTVYDRSWNCNQTIPDYASEGLPEYY